MTTVNSGLKGLIHQSGHIILDDYLVVTIYSHSGLRVHTEYGVHSAVLALSLKLSDVAPGLIIGV